MSFDSGESVALAGTLELTLDSSVDLSGFVGTSIQLFDWTGATVSGKFTFATDYGSETGYVWDTSGLYTTGCVTLTAVPEPGTLALLAAGLIWLLRCVRRKQE